ncbi:uncharacterized protein LOC118186912 isoform X2 [Stegodyphus dumicola]|uniref:uncharacterized protein LOC118186912 isoform X2 n=1 Tax=Stegodyphus dumicola TaxID=202533 RepID=UPI0015A9E70E|nr:uncharacterized protein LOC118186912 isoform X2 [Stegodyphus dumicola]
MPSSECAVATCNNYYAKTKGKGVCYHRFPKNKKIVDHWIAACKREDEFKIENATICSIHFKDEDYQRDLRNELLGIPLRKFLKEDAIPTINLPNVQKRKLSERHERQGKRQRKPEIKPLLEKSPAFIDNDDDDDNNRQEESVMSLKYDQLLQEIKRLKAKNNSLRNDNCILLKTLKTQNESLKKENLLLKQSLEKCRRLIKKHAKEKLEFTKSILSKIFTPGQIKILLGAKRVVWNSKDFVAAIALRTVSRKAYIYLKNQMKIPLPGLSTLRKWESKLSFQRGLQSVALELVNNKGKELTEVSEIVRKVESQELEERLNEQRKAVQVSKSNDPTVIEKEQESYVKQHQFLFKLLTKDVRPRENTSEIVKEAECQELEERLSEQLKTVEVNKTNDPAVIEKEQESYVKQHQFLFELLTKDVQQRDSEKHQSQLNAVINDDQQRETIAQHQSQLIAVTNDDQQRETRLTIAKQELKKDAENETSSGECTISSKIVDPAGNIIGESIITVENNERFNLPAVVQMTEMKEHHTVINIKKERLSPVNVIEQQS